MAGHLIWGILMKKNEGKTKIILKYFGFLVEKYNMKFEFQTFNEYLGFLGPIETYSFYNKNGCFTFHNVVQTGEWNWYRTKEFSYNQYELLEKKIEQRNYLYKSYFFTSSWLRDLSVIIRKQAERSNSAFGIQLKEYN